MQKYQLLLLFLLSCQLNAQDTLTHPIPQWLLDDWAIQTQGSGIWITDNSAYKSDNEPYEAYGIQWEWGLGKKSLKGRLYCILDSKNVGTVWQFLSFWDPLAGQARLIQIGSDGTLGEGTLWQLEGGGSKSLQTFASPDGGTFTSGHQEWMENGERHTQSFHVVDGVWTKRRLYIWKILDQ